jgi:branched-chain amino acid transport system substrate-binding protein
MAAAKDVSIGLASNFSEVSSSSSNPFGGFFRNGIDLAVTDAKEKLAKKNIVIKLVDFDYGNLDSRVIQAAKKAVASDVIAVVGYNFSSHALLAAPIHQQGHLPMLTPSATANRIGSLGAFVHQACFDNEFMGETLARVAVSKLKAKKVAIIAAVDCAYCADLAKAFEAQFVKSGGTISISVPILRADRDLASVMEKLKGQDFDAVLIPNEELLSARIIAALLQHGIKKPVLGGDGWGNVGNEFFGILNGQSFSGYSVSHWHPDEKSARTKKFIADYNRAYGKAPNDTSVLAYDSMSLLIDALIKAPALTREGVENSLTKMRAFTGVTGQFLFRAGKAPRKSLVLLTGSGASFKVLERIEPTAGGTP